MKVNAVIFDVDGVLVDNIGLHCDAWNRFCLDHRLPSIDQLSFRENLFGKTNKDTLTWLFKKTLNDLEIEEFTKLKEGIYRQIAVDQLKPLKGLNAFLYYLQERRIPFAIASSGPRINIDFILDQIGLKNYFSDITDASQVRYGKPNPEVFLITAQKLGIKPAGCIVFEDSIMGIEAAKSAGMRVIALATTYSKSELPQDLEIITDFSELDFERLFKD